MVEATKIRKFTCVSCPVGCELITTLRGDEVIKVEGNVCKRGETYARDEAVDPKRVITALVDVEDSQMPASCKSLQPVSKAKIPECLEVLRSVRLCKPVRIGDTVVANICATGVDVVATRNVE